VTLDIVSRARCFGGTQFVYRHDSSETGTPMRFSGFVPPQAASSKVPVIWFLSGLTCTEENFTIKAGAQRVAADLAGCGKTRAASFACGLFMIPCLGFPAGVSHARIG
jgi:S-formylglutathione hydrolase FrmB